MLAAPLAAFALAAAISAGVTGGGGNGSGDDDYFRTSFGPTISSGNLDAPPTAPPPTAVPTPTPEPNREDCNQIRGTEYRSGLEREWYLNNCLGPAGRPPTQNTQPTGEYALGDRLIIPSAGINSVVTGMKVPPSGTMPNPAGYFNAVWYDFGNFNGLGGYTDGNMVLAGHVDCARCYNGNPGTGVFFAIRNLTPGATIQYVTASGQRINYVVTTSATYDPNINWAGIVATGTADMTLITCTGTFSGGEYNLRHVVHARKQ